MSYESESPDTFAVFGMYRLFAVEDALLGVPRGARLYVGITSRPFQERWDEEKARVPWSWWWPLVDPGLTETVLLNGGKPMWKWQAEKLEARAIQEYDSTRSQFGTLANFKHNRNAGAGFVDLIRATYGDDGLGGHTPAVVGDPPLAAALMAASGAVPYAAAAAAMAAAVAVSAVSLL